MEVTSHDGGRGTQSARPVDRRPQGLLGHVRRVEDRVSWRTDRSATTASDVTRAVPRANLKAPNSPWLQAATSNRIARRRAATAASTSARTGARPSCWNTYARPRVIMSTSVSSSACESRRSGGTSLDDCGTTVHLQSCSHSGPDSRPRFGVRHRPFGSIAANSSRLGDAPGCGDGEHRRMTSSSEGREDSEGLGYEWGSCRGRDSADRSRNRGEVSAGPADAPPMVMRTPVSRDA
jgi:hypothetical protein